MQTTNENSFSDRRRHDRLPVTMTARIRCAGTDHAALILNVSEGGFLLAPPEGLAPTVGLAVEIETTQFGIVPAQVVGISAQGLHLRISRASDAHGQAIRRLAGLIRPWVDGLRFRSWSEA